MVVKLHSALRVSLPVLILLNERLAWTDARFNAQTKCAASNSVYDIIEAAISTARICVLSQHTFICLVARLQIFHINLCRKSVR